MDNESVVPKILAVCLFAVFAAVIFSCSDNAPKGVKITGNKSYEASIFRQHCAVCHGAEAEGKQMEERLVPSLRRGEVAAKTEGEIYKQIADGGNGMTPFRNQLTENELQKMTRFIRYDLQNRR